MSKNPNTMPREEAVIVGAGPVGLAVAISAKRRGLDPLVVDAGAVVNSIVNFPVSMTFFTTPDLLEIGGHPFPCAGEKPTRAEALKYYRGVVRAEGIRTRPWTRLSAAIRAEDGIRCTLETRLGEESVLADRLVLATGYYDNPNLLGVPGEDLPHVSHYFDDPHLSFGQDVVVVGGGNSASEAALDLHRAGASVILVHRGNAVKGTVKYWLKPDVENRIAEGSIDARFGARVVEIGPDRVTIEKEGMTETLPAERVYLLTGYRPDTKFFARVGIDIEPETGVPAHDPDTLETNVPGVHVAGSVVGGNHPSEIFIENGRFDGEKIFER